MVVSHDSFCNPQTLLSPLLPLFLLVIHDTSPYFRRDELFAPFHDLSIYSRLWHNNGLKMFYEIVLKLPQFYIQLVYKPHFRTGILLFGPFGQLRVISSNFYGQKNSCIISLLWIFFFIWNIFWLKIGYRSGFKSWV